MDEARTPDQLESTVQRSRRYKIASSLSGRSPKHAASKGGDNTGRKSDNGNAGSDLAKAERQVSKSSGLGGNGAIVTAATAASAMPDTAVGAATCSSMVTSGLNAAASPLMPPLPPGPPPLEILPPPPPLPPPQPLLTVHPLSLPPPPPISAGSTLPPSRDRTATSTQVAPKHAPCRQTVPSQSIKPQAVQPQYAAPPPVPCRHLNMPYMDRAACQPLPAPPQRQTDVPARREDYAASQHKPYKSAYASNDRDHIRDDRGRYGSSYYRDYRDRYPGRDCNRRDYRDRDQARDYSRGDHRDLRDRGRNDYRRGYGYSGDRSPSRHDRPRHWNLQVEDPRRKAAAVAAAHVDGKAAGATKSAASGSNHAGSRAQPPKTSAVTSGPATATGEGSAAASAAVPGRRPGPPLIDLATLCSGSDTGTGSSPSNTDSQLDGSALGDSTATPSGEPETVSNSDEDHMEQGQVRKSKNSEEDGDNEEGTSARRSSHGAGTKRKVGRKSAGARSSKSSSGVARRSRKDVLAELERALARVALDAKPVPGAATIRLFCGHCGKEQPWDTAGERARPLPDPSAPDGLKRTKDTGRVLYDAKESTCITCGNMIMCNPRSATCIYCDCQLDGFRPSYWKCTNTDGTARKRVLTGAAAARAASAAGTATDSGTKSGGMGCRDHDLRFRGRPRCNCPRLHGAIAGQGCFCLRTSTGEKVGGSFLGSVQQPRSHSPPNS
ncbi:hypothetical protein VOLCADRAFT_99358 [Volvox carteri f. nagariensis]|uniref:Uncharacterized protein n=1 Tax=Volvox carteri f. nagariensis TaxID=3068 RepID=D8UHM0_VOLCA|nr:uncharacterized protein VOLCADRAFT_99358 [Volvox carteri f. nagariensis]EFJ40769.1 hypothetical protein VOLCADRAFT_99358 [Volvox carteri f. nagariensis]|eukprot:XP_002958144.1 hypothetical protein VOLCADRAFT_99358 [Volvox carteri f. nagariensis]